MKTKAHLKVRHLNKRNNKVCGQET